MRRKRPFAVIAFASTEQALAAEAMFTQRGLPGRMIPIPSQVSAGCGLEQALLDALRETGIGFETHALVELFD